MTLIKSSSQTEPKYDLIFTVNDFAVTISFNSLSISYKKYSDCSRRMIFLGLRLIICLANSDPIEPPHPVIRTTLS